MVQIQFNFELHPVSALVPHEMTDAFHRNALLHQIRHNQYLVPIVADRQSGVVLDGHHRLHVAQEMGLMRIPVFFVDYSDGTIEVSSWDENRESYDKEAILTEAASGNLLLPKTTRHRFNGQPISSLTGGVRVPLSELV
ncbi:ParB N-terminal domain-containing protein [Candidatus Micrarchaeota archaeon]|nr:ParB N-terminal domain-containing protein [Candidatus Micrarchaeota archaeon]